MQTIHVDGSDPRGLFGALIAAVKLTKDAKSPAIEFDGQTYAVHRDLIKMLPDEGLTPEHQAQIDAMFQRRQSGYRRTALNLISRIEQIVSGQRIARAAASYASVWHEDRKRQEDAAQQAVAILADCLGSHRKRFLSLMKQAGSDQFEVALKSLRAK